MTMTDPLARCHFGNNVRARALCARMQLRSGLALCVTHAQPDVFSLGCRGVCGALWATDCVGQPRALAVPAAKWRALTFRSCLSLLCNRRVSTHTTVSVSQRMHALATDHSFLSLYPPCAAAQQQSWAMQGWGLLGIRCPRDLPTPYLTASMRRSPWSPVRGSCYGSWRWNGEWGY